MNADNIPFSVYHNIGLYLINPMHAPISSPSSPLPETETKIKTETNEIELHNIEQEPKKEELVAKEESISAEKNNNEDIISTTTNIMKLSGVRNENVKKIDVQEKTNPAQISSQVIREESPTSLPVSPEHTPSTKGCCIIS
jgi:hypothetical protein